MLARGHNTERFNEGLVRLSREFENLARRNLTDQAVHAERLYLRLLNRLYGWELRSADDKSPSFEAIDLLDDDAKVVVQVSVTRDRHKRDKVNRTLAKGAMRGFAGAGYRLKFCFVGEQGDSVKSSGAIRNPHGISFDPKADILLASDLLARFEALDLPGQAEALRILDEETGRIMGPPHTDEETVARINARLERQRRDHPSFLLMEGELDEGLLPKARTIPNAERRASVDGGEPILLSDVFRRSWESEGQRHLYITGPGGIGKTVSLLTFATEDDFLPKRAVAVYVPLYDLAQYHNEKRDCIDAYLRSTFSKKERRAIERLSRRPWQKGPSLILLLDGHNEVPAAKRADVDDGIRKWAERCGTQVVATSRPLGLSGMAHVQQVELRELGKDVVETHLSESGLGLPPEGSNLWQVLKTPLMLRLYADVEAFRNVMRADRIRLKDADSAGHLVWNYLQRELWSTLRWGRGDFSKAEYAAALLITLPYVCWRMEAEHEFKVSGEGLLEYVREACRRWHGKRKPAGFDEVEDDLLSYYDDCDSERVPARQLAILSKERALLSWDGEEYSLLHQSLRDGLAAIHLKNAMEAPYDELPDEFKQSISEYVKDFLADVCEDKWLGELWETNRATSPTDVTATHNLLRVIHRRRDGDLAALDWSGMDVRGLSLYPFKKHARLLLSCDGARFRGTRLEFSCFMPQGHSGHITSLCFSFDDTVLATGSADGTILLWDVATGLQVGSILVSGRDWVNSICFSPFGAMIASGSTDGTIRLWDAIAGRLVEPVHHATWGGSVDSVCFSPDGTILACGNDLGEIRLRDPSSERFDRILFVDERSVGITSLCFSLDGATLAVGSDDGSVRLLGLGGRRREVEPIGRHGGRVTSVSFSPGGHVLASSSVDGTIRLWDAAKGCPIGKAIESPFGESMSVRFSPNGKILAWTIQDGILVWELGSGKPTKPLCEESMRSVVQTIAFSNDSSMLASGSVDGTVRLWNPNTGLLITRLEGRVDPVNSVCFSPDGSLLASGSDDGAVRLWNPTERHLTKQPLSGHTDGVNSVCFSPDGSWLASGSGDGTVRMWGRAAGWQSCSPLSGHTSGVSSVSFSPDGSLLASGSSDGTVLLWDSKERRLAQQPLSGHTGGVSSVSFSPDGSLLASGSDDGTVLLWDPTTGSRCGDPLDLCACGVNDVCFSPDGALLAVGTYDGTVTLWNTATKRIVASRRTCNGHAVNSVRFTPDGSLLAVCSIDGADLWSVVSERQDEGRIKATGYLDWPECVCFSPDGNLLACGAYRGEIVLWKMSRTHESSRPPQPRYVGYLEPLHGIGLVGLDFRQADVEDELDREAMRQNGALIYS